MNVRYYNWRSELKNIHHFSLSIQALQPEIIQNRVGKFIPYIFIEWIHLTDNKANCPHFKAWADNFLQGGYISVDPGDQSQDFLQKLTIHYFQGRWPR